MIRINRHSNGTKYHCNNNATTRITYFTTSKLYNRNLQSLKRKKNKPTKVEKHIHNNVNKIQMQPFFSLNVLFY
jgi:hypothetical protein